MPQMLGGLPGTEWEHIFGMPAPWEVTSATGIAEEEDPWAPFHEAGLLDDCP